MSADSLPPPTPTHEAYDIAGYRVLVGATPSYARRALHGILRGFGPVGLDSKDGLPHYDLAPAGNRWHICRDGTAIQVESTLPGALGVLEWHLVTAALDHRRDLFHLHGGALAIPGERASILLVGDSGSGKTTLTMALMQRGFLPFADDVVLMDPSTLAPCPLRRAFHVSAGTWRLLQSLPGGTAVVDPALPPEYHFPSRWAVQPAPVKWLVHLARDAGARPRLVPLAVAEAAATVLANTSSLTRTTRLALSTCARLTERAACFRLITGDLPASVGIVEGLVGADGS